MKLKYVGTKEQGSTAFSSESGIPVWVIGDVHDIKDAALAGRMLKHPDVFALADESEQKKPDAEVKKDEEVKNDDGLDALDKTALLALAKEANLSIHHASGEDKIRTALREAKKADQ